MVFWKMTKKAENPEKVLAQTVGLRYHDNSA